jgi:hypothetical protein
VSATEPGLSATRRITQLLASRPGAYADPEERAAWFEAKAEVFELIADGDAYLRTEALEMAAKARADAAAQRARAGLDNSHGGPL